MPNYEDDEDGDDDAGEDFLSDPLTEEQIKDQMCSKLTERHGFTQDELDTLFPTFAELETFFNETFSRAGRSAIDANSKDYDTEDGKAPEDDSSLVLSKTDTRRIQEIRQAKAEYRKKLLELRKQFQQLAAQQQTKATKEAKESARKAFEEAGSHLPPEDRVSYAEYLKNLENDAGLKDLLSDMGDDDEDE